MIVAGVDVGSATAKAVVLKDDNDNLTSFASIISTGKDSFKAGENVLKEALQQLEFSLQIADIDYIVATGYGRVSLSFANKTITEIACHAKGAYSTIPSVRSIIDIGGQDSKAIRLNDMGNVTNFVMNDKCAAGSGRFLEVMAGVLETPLNDFGGLALKSQKPCKINNVCTIFAESEIVCLRAERKPLEDIVAGIHYSIARRVSNMASILGSDGDLVFTGGVAKNEGMRHALEDEMNRPIVIPPNDPQLMGAFGAALFAKELIMK